MFNKEFWLDTLERAIYTACECAVGYIGSASVLAEVDWLMCLSTVGVAAIVTVLKCIMVNTKEEE